MESVSPSSPTQTETRSIEPSPEASNASQTSALTVLTGLSMGILATWLAFNQAIGLGLALTLLLMLGALFAHSRIRRTAPPRRTLVLLVPILFFIGMLAIRSDQTLISMNLLAVIGLGLLLVYFFVSGNILAQSIFDYPIKALLSSLDVWFRPFAELTSGWRWLTTRGGSWKAFAPVLRGLVITVPLVLIFVGLLSSADAVFSKLVSDLFKNLFPRDIWDLTAQLVFVALFAWLTIGGLASAFVDRKSKRDTGSEAKSAVPSPQLSALFRLGFVEAMMALVGVCIVFAAFVVIQFVYLFGGARNIANFSYAEYVHRGFLELVSVGLLTLGVVFVFSETTQRSSPARERLFRGFSTLLVALTGVILVSAFQRLHLYELTYGYTALRLEIYVFICWLGFTFLGFTLSLYWKPKAINVFSVCLLSAVIGYTATLDLINPDAVVAWQNIQRGDLDPMYLSTLSVEAVPALVTLADAPEPGLRAAVRHTLAVEGARAGTDSRDWRGWSLARANAARLLKVGPGASEGDPAVTGNNVLEQKSKLADFAPFLHKGMTVRAVVRQLGLPSYNSGRDSEFGDDRSGTMNYVLYYYLKTNGQVALVFDTAEGLQSACVVDAKNECLDLSR